MAEFECSDVESLAGVDWVAKGQFPCLFMSLHNNRLQIWWEQLTGTTQPDGALSMLGPQCFNRRVHRHQPSIDDCTREHWFRSLYSDQIFSYRAMHSIGSDDNGCSSCGTIFEFQNYAMLILFKVLEPFIEMGALRRNPLDQFVEKVGTVYSPP